MFLRNLIEMKNELIFIHSASHSWAEDPFHAGAWAMKQKQVKRARQLSISIEWKWKQRRSRPYPPKITNSRQTDFDRATRIRILHLWYRYLTRIHFWYAFLQHRQHIRNMVDVWVWRTRRG